MKCPKCGSNRTKGMKNGLMKCKRGECGHVWNPALEDLTGTWGYEG